MFCVHNFEVSLCEFKPRTNNSNQTRWGQTFLHSESMKCLVNFFRPNIFSTKGNIKSFFRFSQHKKFISMLSTLSNFWMRLKNIFSFGNLSENFYKLSYSYCLISYCQFHGMLLIASPFLCNCFMLFVIVSTLPSLYNIFTLFVICNCFMQLMKWRW